MRLPLDADWADASVVLTSLDGDAPLAAAARPQAPPLGVRRLAPELA